MKERKESAQTTEYTTQNRSFILIENNDNIFLVSQTAASFVQSPENTGPSVSHVQL